MNWFASVGYGVMFLVLIFNNRDVITEKAVLFTVGSVLVLSAIAAISAISLTANANISTKFISRWANWSLIIIWFALLILSFYWSMSEIALLSSIFAFVFPQALNILTLREIQTFENKRVGKIDYKGPGQV